MLGLGMGDAAMGDYGSGCLARYLPYFGAVGLRPWDGWMDGWVHC